MGIMFSVFACLVILLLELLTAVQYPVAFVYLNRLLKLECTIHSDLCFTVVLLLFCWAYVYMSVLVTCIFRLLS